MFNAMVKAIFGTVLIGAVVVAFIPVKIVLIAVAVVAGALSSAVMVLVGLASAIERVWRR